MSAVYALTSPYSANGSLPIAKAKRHEDGPAQAQRGAALEVRTAQVGIVGDVLGELGIGDHTVRAPQIRQRIELAVERGVLARNRENLRDELIHLDPALVDRLVDAEVPLHAGEAIDRRLRQIEAGAVGGVQLGDDFLVVRERDLDR